MNRVSELRKERDLTQEDLAKVLSVQRQALSKYENESILMTADTIILLSSYFDVTTDYLLGLSDNRASMSQKGKVSPTSELTKEEDNLLKAFRAVKSEKIKQAVIDILEDSANPATTDIELNSSIQKNYKDKKEQTNE